MKINVVLVSYNHAKYIEEAFSSIIMQCVPSDYQVELIIADDASNDDTREILRHLSVKSPYKVTFLPEEPNMGHPQNYKRAFMACDGDYIAILEGDDYWSSPLHIQSHVSFMDLHRECVLTMNRSVLFYQDEATYAFGSYNCEDDVWYISGKEMALNNCLGNLSSCVIRRSALNKLDEKIYDFDMDDWLLGLALAKYGFLCKFKAATSVWRIHSLGQWSGLSDAGKYQRVMTQIDNYDKFLNGIYHKEFCVNRQRVASQLSLKKKSGWKKSMKQYLPPVFMGMLKILLPPCVWKS